MGMFDSINGEQLKCFGIPCYYENSGKFEVAQMGGLLRNFHNGNKVPYKTYYYNYSPNFCIVDIHCLDRGDLAVIHIIRDGKVKKSIKLKDLTDDELTNSDKIIDYYGNELDIKTKEDIEFLIEDRDYYLEQMKMISAESDKILYHDLFLITKQMRELKNTSEEYKQKENEYNELYKKYEALKEREEPLMDSLKACRIEKYYIKKSDIFYKCEELGEYIAAEMDYYKKGFPIEKINNMKNYIFELIKDEELVQEYCKMQEITERQFYNIIKKIKKHI